MSANQPAGHTMPGNSVPAARGGEHAFVLPLAAGALFMSLSTDIVALNAQLLRRVRL